MVVGLFDDSEILISHRQTAAFGECGACSCCKRRQRKLMILTGLAIDAITLALRADWPRRSI